MTVTFPNTLNLENREKGHAGALTEEQVATLKALWLRLFTVFEQPGEEIQIPKEEDTKKASTGFFGFGAAKEGPKDYFLGKTIDPRWASLPLEKALVLIPGKILRQSFWGLVTVNNPDATLLRFLRARKWDLEAAYQMLMNTLRWRLEMRLDEIVALGQTGLIEELEKAKEGLGVAFEKQLNLKMVTLGGPDKEARGICFINVQLHNKDNQPQEIMKLLTVYIMELSRVICEYPMDSVCIVFSLDNFTMANMDLDIVKFLVNCFQAHYPETLGRACVYKAPWVFNTIWTLIAPLLDPVVASKVAFPANLEELENYVSRDSLPIILSGDETKPVLDDLPAKGIPKAGTKTPPADHPKLIAHEKFVIEYETKTKSWAENKTFGGDEDALNRLKLAQDYRISRIKAERVTRGETSYHLKGLIRYDENDRVYLNYNTPSWKEQDITAWV